MLLLYDKTISSLFIIYAKVKNNGNKKNWLTLFFLKRISQKKYKFMNLEFI